ncbi:MAG: T9SS type A sorting domain-containing protein [Hymenobacteraceae bacterium]|nr:T9SS type A sorting domain-containing protein [Hymenobacteraceae bacterium]MDX5483010.1 T9SS type A sorting domain-containing protein [Hymenobacteraceae bacterium]
MEHIYRIRSWYTFSFLLFLFYFHTEATAQVALTSSGGNFDSYSQDFNTDKLPQRNGEAKLWINGTAEPGSESTLNGWYLGVEGYEAGFIRLEGNDGSNTNWGGYSYGADASPERSMGLKGEAGVAGTFYAALRFVNNTGQNIDAVEVSFDMEQWYFDGDVSEVSLEYAVGPDVVSPISTIVTWYPVAVVNSPLAGAGIAKGAKDGNAAGNNKPYTLTATDLKLPKGQEIAFRWVVRLTSDSRRYSALALDNVTVTPTKALDDSEMPAPVATVYYNKAGQLLDDTNSWGTNRDGTGNRPPNFTDPNQTFYVVNTAGHVADESKKYREDNHTLKLGKSWQVRGEGSKVVLGDGAKPVKMIVHHNKLFDGPMDLAAQATLIINTGQGDPALGTLAPQSTVVYADSTSLDVASTTYGNLVILGEEYSKGQAVLKKLKGAASVAGKLELIGKNIHLQENVLQIEDSGEIGSAGAGNHAITSEGGALQMAVSGSEVLFPVGTDSYAPVRIKNGGNATYRVGARQLEGALKSASADYAVPAVDKVWEIARVDASGAGASTVTLQWNRAANIAGLDKEYMYVGHYNRAAGRWEAKPVDSFREDKDGFYTLTFTADAAADDGNAASADLYTVMTRSETIFLVYPNPARGVVQVELPLLASNAELEVFSMSGEEIEVHQVTAGVRQVELDFSDYNGGMYLLRLQTPGRVYVYRLVLQ